MTAPSADLENSIRLALEAAEAANDTAEEVARLSSDTQAAAERLDRFAKTMKPLVLGTLAGTIAAVAIGGLVYFRTLSDMRTTAATQIEALTLFSKSVTDLQAQVDVIQAMEEQISQLPTAQEGRFNQFEAKLADMEARVTEQISVAATAMAATAEPVPVVDDGTNAQMLRSVNETVVQSHQETQAAFVSGLSDLQLAMTRLLADSLSSAAATTAAKPAVAATTPPRKVSAKPSPKRTSAPASKNPFKYP